MRNARDWIVGTVAMVLLLTGFTAPVAASPSEWEYPLLPAGRSLYFRSELGEAVVGDALEIRTPRGNLVDRSIAKIHYEEIYGESAAAIFPGIATFTLYADEEPITLVPDKYGRNHITDELLGKTLEMRISFTGENAHKFEPIVFTEGRGGYGVTDHRFDTFGPVVPRGARGPKAEFVQSGAVQIVKDDLQLGNKLGITFATPLEEGVRAEVCWFTRDPEEYDAPVNNRGCRPEFLLTAKDLGNRVDADVYLHKQGEATQIQLLHQGKWVRTRFPDATTSLDGRAHLVINKPLTGMFNLPPLPTEDYLWYQIFARFSDGSEVVMEDRGVPYEPGAPVPFTATMPDVGKETWGKTASIVVKLWSDAHQEREFLIAKNLVVSGPEVIAGDDFKIEISGLEATRGHAMISYNNFTLNLGAACTNENKCLWEWLLDGKPVVSSRAEWIRDPFFEITPALAGRKLAARVTLTDPSYGKKVYTTPNLTVPKVLFEAPYPVRQAEIVGRHQVGRTVRVKNPVWSLTGTRTVNYQWYAGGKKIKHATQSTYVIRRQDVGKQISVEMRSANPSALSGWVGVYAANDVAKSLPTVKAKLSKSTIRRTKSTRLALRVSAPGTKTPVGKISVTVGGKRFTTSLKAKHKGKTTLNLKGLKVGKRQAIKVKFVPSRASTGKFSKSSKTVTVARVTVKW